MTSNYISGNIFDYSKKNWINRDPPVQIICSNLADPEHGNRRTCIQWDQSSHSYIFPLLPGPRTCLHEAQEHLLLNRDNSHISHGSCSRQSGCRIPTASCSCCRTECFVLETRSSEKNCLPPIKETRSSAETLRVRAPPITCLVEQSLDNMNLCGECSWWAPPLHAGLPTVSNYFSATP